MFLHPTPSNDTPQANADFLILHDGGLQLLTME
jgi:hypothetical protein